MAQIGLGFVMGDPNQSVTKHSYAGSRWVRASPDEAADWLDRTVNVTTLRNRTLPEWIDEFRRLKRLNEEIMDKVAPKKVARRRGSRTAE